MVNQRRGPPRPTYPAMDFFKMSLPAPCGFLLPDRDVSVGLVRKHLPAAGQAGQDRGFGPALRQQHETMAFIGLGSAAVCMIHVCAFAGSTEDSLFPIDRRCLPRSGHTTNQDIWRSLRARLMRRLRDRRRSRQQCCDPTGRSRGKPKSSHPARRTSRRNRSARGRTLRRKSPGRSHGNRATPA